jgi:hypothetical protein
LGQEFVVGWIFVQQQLPREFEDGTIWSIIWTIMPHPAQLDRAGEKAIFGLDIVVEAEATIRHIQENLKVAKLRQESYANKRRRPLQFEAGDHVYLKVSPMKGVKRFGVTGKLSPRYIGPFQILEKCGKVAYKLELPPSLAGVHDIFHVSQLKKCLKPPVDIVLPEVAPLDMDLTYPERPIKILNQKSRVTRRKTIKFYKIQWSNHTEEEATWESEDFLRSRHPDFELPQAGNVRLFAVPFGTFLLFKSRDEILF